MTDAARSSADQTAGPPRDAGRIVVGVDGSEGSLVALAWSLREARLRDTSVHAVIGWTYDRSWGYWGQTGMGGTFPSGGMHIGGLGPPMHDPGEPDAADAAAVVTAVSDVLNGAISWARQQVAGSQEQSVTITGEAVQGHAVQMLLDAVTESDLLVVGSRGHGGFIGTVLGSVSHHVVSHARCPVVVVPEPQHTPPVAGR